MEASSIAGTQAEWRDEVESTILDSATYKRLKLHGSKCFRGVNLRRGASDSYFGLGDFVHVGSDDPNNPYVARIAALYEDKDGVKFARLQWMYRPSDLKVKLTPVAPNEVFPTTHNDANRVEVIIEPVRIKVYRSVDDPVISRLAADVAGPSPPDSIVASYIITRIYDHTKKRLRQLDATLGTALSYYSDNTSDFALSLQAPRHRPTNAGVKDSSRASPLSEQSKLDGAHGVEIDGIKTTSGIDDPIDKTNISSNPDSTNTDVLSANNLPELDGRDQFQKTTSDGDGNPIRQQLGINQTVEDIVIDANSTVLVSTLVDTDVRLPGISKPRIADDEPEIFPPVKRDGLSSSNVGLVHDLIVPVEIEQEWSKLKHVLQAPFQNFFDLVRSGKSVNDLGDDIHPALRAALSIEHAHSCSSEDCWCSGAQDLLQHAHGAADSCGDDKECDRCAMYEQAVLYHAINCQEDKNKCKIPLCEISKPSVWMEHSASCFTQDCSSRLCTKMKSLLLHLASCDVKSSQIKCEECADASLILNMHAKLGCLNGRCHFPLCPHFAAALHHNRRRNLSCRMAKPCLECVLFTKIQEKHVPECDAELGACCFPQCKGRRQHQVEERSPKRMRANSSSGIRVGSEFQAICPPFSSVASRPSLMPKTTTEGVEEINLEADLKIGSIVTIRVPGEDESLQYMTVRLVTLTDEDGFFRCVPFDVSFPQFEASDIDQYLVFRVRIAAIVPFDEISIDGRSRKVFVSEMHRKLAEWSAGEYDAFTKALLVEQYLSNRARREGDWISDALRRLTAMGSTKTTADITALYYSMVRGIDGVPPRVMYCSACTINASRHACKRFFSCHVSYCETCLKANVPPVQSGIISDEVEDETWFCAQCVNTAKISRQPPHPITCKIIRPNDGYDPEACWNGRTIHSSVSFADAVAALDEVLHTTHSGVYDTVVDMLLKLWLGTISSDGFLAFIASLAQYPAIQDVVKRAIGKFLPDLATT